MQGRGEAVEAVELGLASPHVGDDTENFSFSNQDAPADYRNLSSPSVVHEGVGLTAAHAHPSAARTVLNSPLPPKASSPADPPKGESTVRSVCVSYFEKFAGQHCDPPSSRPNMCELVRAFIGAFVGIAIPASLHFLELEKEDQVMLIGSFGASAVLLYGAIDSPLGQPRNVLGGHVISAFVGVCIRKLILVDDDYEFLWLACALAVALSVVLMQLTGKKK